MSDLSKYSEGRDENGNYAIQIRIRKDDPIAPYVVALAEAASHAQRDIITGFTFEKEADASKGLELEEIIMGLLPEDLKEKFHKESAVTKDRTMSSISSMLGATPLSGLVGLLGGNVFQQMDAVKNNPGLAPLEKMLAGKIGKDTIGSMLGDTVLGNHMKDQLFSGKLDDVKKEGSDGNTG